MLRRRSPSGRRAMTWRLALPLVVGALAVAPGAQAREGSTVPTQEATHDAHTAHAGAEGAGEHHAGPFKRHRIAFYTGNGIVPSGGENEDRIGTVLVPTLAVDYEYWLSRKFALGWYNDFTLTTFVVETNRPPPAEQGAGAASSEGGKEVIEREQTFLTSLVVVYEPVERLALFTGLGREFEESESFWVWKVGLEYGFPLPGDWDIAIGVSYDYKEVYDSFGIGVSFGKRFGTPR